jgi:N-acetylgalactosamine kinase
MTTIPTTSSSSAAAVSPIMTNMLTTFQERYGMPATHIITAPGRVNLIGEHIDYGGYDVLPMAISKMVHVAFCYHIHEHEHENENENENESEHDENENNEESSFIEIQHVNNASFPPGRFSTDPAVAIPNDNHAWYHYVQCGYKGAHLLYMQQQQNGNVDTKRRIKMLLDGTIPLAAGLSSSSALVVASTVAFLHDAATTSNSFTGSLETLAEICRQAEGYIGTMGGGMDQAISVCGNARLVSLSPGVVKTEKVKLPKDAVFVIAHSLTNSEKAVGAHLSYNKRVVEMMLSCKVLGVQLKLPNVLHLKTFKQVQEAYALKMEVAAVSLDDMATLVTSQLHSGGYSDVDIAAILSPSFDDNDNDDIWTTWFPHASSEELVWIENVKKAASTYALQERALHVYQEASRVHAFADACRNTSTCSNESEHEHDSDKNNNNNIKKPLLEMLGNLMNSSHTSCKDLYDCSSMELDTLVKTCLDLGAVGSRLTGAGWGGSTVSLVAQENVEDFMNGLKKTFYADHILEKNNNFNDICFAAVPTPGVSIYNVVADV